MPFITGAYFYVYFNLIFSTFHPMNNSNERKKKKKEKKRKEKSNQICK